MEFVLPSKAPLSNCVLSYSPCIGWRVYLSSLLCFSRKSRFKIILGESYQSNESPHYSVQSSIQSTCSWQQPRNHRELQLWVDHILYITAIGREKRISLPVNLDDFREFTNSTLLSECLRVLSTFAKSFGHSGDSCDSCESSMIYHEYPESRKLSLFCLELRPLSGLSTELFAEVIRIRATRAISPNKIVHSIESYCYCLHYLQSYQLDRALGDIIDYY